MQPHTQQIAIQNTIHIFYICWQTISPCNNKFRFLLVCKWHIIAFCFHTFFRVTCQFCECRQKQQWWDLGSWQIIGLTHFHLVMRLRMNVTTHLPPHIPSCHEQGQLHLLYILFNTIAIKQKREGGFCFLIFWNVSQIY